jgi:hypothetical protein
MFAYALTAAGGPLVGLPAFTLLLVAVLACRGEPWPADERSGEKLAAPQEPSPAG